MDIVERLRDAGDHAFFDPHLHHKAADEIERLREALKPFAEEAIHWVNYSDSEPMVESFPDYEGNVTVGNCRRAFDILNKVR